MPSGTVATRSAVVESECLLTKRERGHIDHYLARVSAGGEPFDLRLLDYRWWECRRRCGFDPRLPGVYDWWCGLMHVERVELARLSKAAGMRAK